METEVDILDPVEILETEIETIIESIIDPPETAPETPYDVGTLGAYDDYVPVPEFLPELETNSDGDVVISGNAYNYLRDTYEENGALTVADYMKATYLQERSIARQLTCTNILIGAVLAALLIGEAVRR